MQIRRERNCALIDGDWPSFARLEIEIWFQYGEVILKADLINIEVPVKEAVGSDKKNIEICMCISLKPQESDYRRPQKVNERVTVTRNWLKNWQVLLWQGQSLKWNLNYCHGRREGTTTLWTNVHGRCDYPITSLVFLHSARLPIHIHNCDHPSYPNGFSNEK